MLGEALGTVVLSGFERSHRLYQAMLLRGHTTDLSAVANVAGPAKGAALKLNRRRKARLRDAGQLESQQPTDDQDD